MPSYPKRPTRPDFEFLDDWAAAMPIQVHLLLGVIGMIIGYFLIPPPRGFSHNHKIGAFLGFFIGFLSVYLAIKIIRYAFIALIIGAALCVVYWIFKP